MPAAAVIPAPIAYINIAAVKKLVVEVRDGPDWSALWCVPVGLFFRSHAVPCPLLGEGGVRAVYFEQIRVL